MIKNFIYPEVVDTELLKGLYCEKKEKLRLDELFKSSNNYKQKAKLDNFFIS